MFFKLPVYLVNPGWFLALKKRRQLEKFRAELNLIGERTRRKMFDTWNQTNLPQSFSPTKLAHLNFKLPTLRNKVRLTAKFYKNLKNFLLINLNFSLARRNLKEKSTGFR